MVEVCRDIDQGLASLNRKIDEQNKKIRDLERKQAECCKDKDNDKKTDLSALLKRLDESEKNILELGGVIKDIVDDLKDLLDAATEHNETTKESQGIFSAIIDFFIDE